jgi:hypothetical protein
MSKDKNSNDTQAEKDQSDVTTGSTPDSASSQGDDKLNEGGKGPAFIKKLSTSVPPKPPESGDIIYLSANEISLNDQIHTIRTVLVPNNEIDPDKHNGPWIMRCIGRDPETKKLRVVRIPAREREIDPMEVMQYLGSVVQDRQSVHTATIVYPGKTRNGFVFDHFYYHNGRKEPRCCWIPNPVHRAALVYEKAVDKRTREAFARIKRIKGPMGTDSGEPMYKIFGAKEADYRDLKRIFERHFLKRGPEDLADDIGLRKLLG